MMNMNTFAKAAINGVKTVWENSNGRKGTILLGTEIASAIISDRAGRKGNHKVQKGAMIGTLVSFAASQYYLRKASKEFSNQFYYELGKLHNEIDDVEKFYAENDRMKEFYAENDDSINEVEKHFAKKEGLNKLIKEEPDSKE